MSTADVPTAPHRIPVAGHVVWLMRDLVGSLQSLRGHGELVMVRLGSRPVYVVNSPGIISRILVEDADRFGKGRFFDSLRTVVGNGLGTSEGEFHLRQKRLMMAAFQPDRIQRYVEVMREQTEEAMAAWVPGVRFELSQAMHELNLRIVCRALFHAELEDQTAAALMRWFPVFSRGVARQTILPGPLNRLPTAANRRFRRARGELDRLLDRVVDVRREDPVDHGDVLSALTRAVDEATGARMDRRQLRDELLTVLLAGTEASSPALGWMFYELARDPALDARLHREVSEVLGSRPVAYRDLGSLTFTRSLIDETLRRYSPLVVSMRRSNAPVELGGHRFPAGTEFLFSTTALHRDPALYPDPDAFDPDRASGRRPRGEYIPFGAGRHRCAGERFALAQMAVVAATVARSWRLDLAPGGRTRERASLTVHPDRIVMQARPRPRLERLGSAPGGRA